MDEVDHGSKSMVVSYFAGRSSIDRKNPSVRKFVMQYALWYLRSTVDLDLMILIHSTDSTSR